MERNKPFSAPEDFAGCSREELRCMLAEELQKDSSAIDDALVRQLMAELRAGGTTLPLIEDTAVEAACEKFRADTKKAAKRWYQSWLVKAASILLVLSIAFFAFPCAAQAGNIHEILSWWTDSVFQLFKPGSQINFPAYVYTTDNPDLQKVYDTVVSVGITTPLVPSWVPEGLVLTELKSYQMNEVTAISAHLVSDDQSVLLTIIFDNYNSNFRHEKDTQNLLVWELSDIEHHVVSNAEETIVTWVIEGIECTITTDCAGEDVFKIVKSIYTSEA